MRRSSLNPRVFKHFVLETLQLFILLAIAGCPISVCRHYDEEHLSQMSVATLNTTTATAVAASSTNTQLCTTMIIPQQSETSSSSLATSIISSSSLTSSSTSTSTLPTATITTTTTATNNIATTTSTLLSSSSLSSTTTTTATKTTEDGGNGKFTIDYKGIQVDTVIHGDYAYPTSDTAIEPITSTLMVSSSFDSNSRNNNIDNIKTNYQKESNEVDGMDYIIIPHQHVKDGKRRKNSKTLRSTQVTRALLHDLTALSLLTVNESTSAVYPKHYHQHRHPYYMQQQKQPEKHVDDDDEDYEKLQKDEEDESLIREDLEKINNINDNNNNNKNKKNNNNNKNNNKNNDNKISILKTANQHVYSTTKPLTADAMSGGSESGIMRTTSKAKLNKQQLLTGAGGGIGAINVNISGISGNIGGRRTTSTSTTNHTTAINNNNIRASMKRLDEGSKNTLVVKPQKTDAPMLSYIFDTLSAVNKHHHHDQRYGPHFEDVQRVGQRTNLTVQAGTAIHLNCRISLLQDKTVSWVRRNSQSENALDLMTVGLHTYTGDKRFKMEFQYPNNWRLKITNVKKDDEAMYECQISTHPPRVIQINLLVNAPKVMIVDEFGDPLQEKYYEIDSTLQLSCVVRNVAMSMAVVYWKHGDNILNYDVTRGGVSVKTELMDDGANSTLYIAKIKKADSGNYTCSISDYQNFSVLVHILNGESFAELHHGGSVTAQMPLSPTLVSISSIILILLRCSSVCIDLNSGGIHSALVPQLPTTAVYLPR